MSRRCRGPAAGCANDERRTQVSVRRGNIASGDRPLHYETTTTADIFAYDCTYDSRNNCRRANSDWSGSTGTAPILIPTPVTSRPPSAATRRRCVFQRRLIVSVA